MNKRLELVIERPAGLQNRIKRILHILRIQSKNFASPALDQIIQEFGTNPFYILISCLLSLRTKDTTSIPVSKALFEKVKTPRDLVAIPLQKLEEIIYSIGFYKKKALIIKSVSQELIERFAGVVPSTEQELLSINGIGQKTAAAVLGYAFNKPALCVDTHVHRLSNRLGFVTTKTADQTRQNLQQIIPQKNWTELNYLLVTWGQNICTPIGPRCSECSISHLCPKIGVLKSR